MYLISSGQGEMALSDTFESSIGKNTERDEGELKGFPFEKIVMATGERYSEEVAWA